MRSLNKHRQERLYIIRSPADIDVLTLTLVLMFTIQLTVDLETIKHYIIPQELCLYRLLTYCCPGSIPKSRSPVVFQSFPDSQRTAAEMGKVLRRLCTITPVALTASSLILLLFVTVGQLSHDNKAPLTLLGRDLYFLKVTEIP